MVRSGYGNWSEVRTSWAESATSWSILKGTNRSTLSVIGCRFVDKVALSSCRCQVQVCNRQSRNIDWTNEDVGQISFKPSIFTCFIPCRLSDVSCRVLVLIFGFIHRWLLLLLVAGCRLSSADCRLSGATVGGTVVVCCWLQGVGCRVLVIGCLYRVLRSCSIVGAQLWVSTTIYFSRTLIIFICSVWYGSFPCSTPHWRMVAK